MEKEYEKKYHDVEKTHFWFRGRRNYILQILKNKPKDLSILDVGCSSGILIKDLEKMGFQTENLYGIDISSVAIENCKKNGIKNVFVMDAQQIDIKKKFDIVIASDCLEHIENDEKALENWNSLLKPNGELFVFVPAFMSLWSIHDVVNMHFRRYRKTELKNKIRDANFEITRVGYWNFLLFLPIFLVRTLSKKFNSAEKKQTEGDLNKISIFNGLLLALINFENLLLKFFNFPFGVSCFCFAKKKKP